jgi:hypothetical protein
MKHTNTRKHILIKITSEKHVVKDEDLLMMLNQMIYRLHWDHHHHLHNEEFVNYFGEVNLKNRINVSSKTLFDIFM